MSKAWLNRIGLKSQATQTGQVTKTEKAKQNGQTTQTEQTEK
jgi:hypothetical protein